MNEALLERARGRRPQRGAGLAKALVVSTRQVSRSMLTHHLRQLGVAEVRHASRHSEARRVLENQHHDLVVFDEADEQHKKHEPPQVLIDDLRRCGLLEINTVVIITAGSATYTQVAEAAESGIDSYLLRPYSLASLEQRVRAAVARRESMAEVYAALKAKDYEAALEACLVRYAQRGAFWLYAARIAAEIYIARGCALQAQELYQAIVEQEALPWAKLGVGRALIEQGKHEAAVQHLDEVLKLHPEQTDAYDLMGRAYLERGQREQAVAVYRLAAKATPTSVSRQQRLGFALYFNGQTEEALQVLQRCAHMGLRSKSFDLQVLWTLAYEAAHQQRAHALHDVQQRLQWCAEAGVHDAAQLGRLKESIEALECLMLGLVPEARGIVQHLLQQVGDEGFDFDSACNLVQLLAWLAHQQRADESMDDGIERIGLRFAHSRLASAWLARAAQMHPPYSERLQQAHELAFRRAQDIMRYAIAGDPARAMTDLVNLAKYSLNARIIEMAQRALERYGHQVEAADDLRRVLGDIVRTNDPVTLKRNPSSRQLRHPGGISLLHKL